MVELLSMTPIRQILVILLLIIAFIFARYCVRYFRMIVGKEGHADRPMAIVRGLRGLVISLTTLAWAAGIYWEEGWLLIIGLVILVQEMYEMGVLSMILRYGETHVVSKGTREHP